MKGTIAMKRTTRLFIFATAFAAGGAFATQEPSVHVGFALRSSTVESGVPVIVTVTVRNDSDTESSQLLPVGRYEVDWIVRSRAGAEVAQWKPTGDVASELTRILPHAVRRFSIVAAGTAAIQVPGEYEIIPHYHSLDVSEGLPFTVVPSNAQTLGLRAQEFHDAAIVKGEDGLTAAEALASMAYAVPTSQLCDVMERNPLAPNFIGPRLEAVGGPDAIHCLIRVMSGAPVQGIYIQWALQRLGKNEKDPALRSEIEHALRQ
jgi:hypothetical protein